MNTNKTVPKLIFIELLAIALVAYKVATSFDARIASTTTRFLTIDDLFAPELKHGWTISKAPVDNRAYRKCGFAYSSPERSGREWMPTFRSESATLECPVEIPDGKIICVVCLQPRDGGSMRYAVLARDIAQQEITKPGDGG